MTHEITSYTQCRTPECAARIFWAQTEKTQRPMPVNADPAENGNLVLVRGGDFPVVRVYGNNTSAIPEDAPRYVSHFSTCIAASDWRSRGGS